MSTEAFSSLPLQAGQAVASSAGRAAKWAFAAYMRAPLRNTAIAGLTTLCAMAGSNALYNQTGQHPAPLFGSFNKVTSESAPMPLEKPVQLLAKPAPAPETTGSVNRSAEAIPAKPIGNEDVFEIQRKLTAFKLFDGKVDGLYGPRTARSIRAFEESVGRKPTGQLTQEIIDLIKATPITADPSATHEAAAVAPPAPLAEVTTEAPVLALETPASLPAPEPLVVVEEEQVAAPVVEQQTAAVETATGIQTLEMTSPPAAQAVVEDASAPTKRAVQTIAVRAPAPEATATALPEVITTPIDPTKAATDPKVVGAVQRGLSSLGFLHGEIDGVAGEATAKAIRNFEVYYNYNVTGRITPELLNLLAQNGAVI